MKRASRSRVAPQRSHRPRQVTGVTRNMCQGDTGDKPERACRLVDVASRGGDTASTTYRKRNGALVGAPIRPTTEIRSMPAHQPSDGEGTPAADHTPADFPRPLGAPPIAGDPTNAPNPAPVGSLGDIRIRCKPETAVRQGAESEAGAEGGSSDDPPSTFDFARSDSLSGHVNNAAQIISLAAQLGETLDAQQLAAIRRRLLAALMILEGVA